MHTSHVTTILKYRELILNENCFQIPRASIREFRQKLSQETITEDDLTILGKKIHDLYHNLLEVHRIVKHAQLQLQVSINHDRTMSSADATQLSQKMIQGLLSLESQVEHLQQEIKAELKNKGDLKNKSQEIVSLFEDFLANYAIIKATLST